LLSDEFGGSATLTGSGEIGGVVVLGGGAVVVLGGGVTTIIAVRGDVPWVTNTSSSLSDKGVPSRVSNFRSKERDRGYCVREQMSSRKSHKNWCVEFVIIENVAAFILKYTLVGKEVELISSFRKHLDGIPETYKNFARNRAYSIQVR